MNTRKRNITASAIYFILFTVMSGTVPLFTAFAAESNMTAGITEVAKQTVAFQKNAVATVGIINDGNREPGPWLLEITPQTGIKATLRLPLPDGMFEEMRAATFVSPEKQELFISFTQAGNGMYTWCYVVDFSDGAAKIVFDSEWTSAAFAAEGVFDDWYRVDVAFPKIFDQHMLFIKDAKRKSDYAQAGIFDAATEKIVTPRAIHGSYLTAASLAEPDTGGLLGLRLSFAVAGAAEFDILGTYAGRLQYQSGKWKLQGDMQFVPETGVEWHREEESIPVQDLELAWVNGKFERKLPMPFASVQRIQSQAEFDALRNDYSDIAGNFDATATDTWFFVPFATPATFTIHEIKNNGGDIELTGIKGKYPLKTGQAFVYSGNWQQFTEETGGMEFQYVISFQQGEGGEEHFLWFLPDDTDVYLLRPGISKPHKE